MKPLVRILCLFLLLPVYGFSQPASSVLLVDYPYDSETIVEQMNTFVGQGYLPVGIEVTPGQGLSVLYIWHAVFDTERWMIRKFEDLSDLEQDFTALIMEDWFPMDISYAASGMYVLFATSPFEVSRWRISSSSVDPEQIQETLDRYSQEGFYPWGISAFDNRLWFLFLDIGPQAFSEFDVVFFRADDAELIPLIEAETETGRAPWAIMKRGNVIAILYAG